MESQKAQIISSKYVCLEKTLLTSPINLSISSEHHRPKLNGEPRDQILTSGYEPLYHGPIFQDSVFMIQSMDSWISSCPRLTLRVD
ncbi:hypothetical protein ACTXT7_012323 [Hymenolepis weldensis]